MAVEIEKLKRVTAHTQYRTKDGTRVPGVTTVLGVLNKPALVPWANKLGLQGIDTRKYVDKLASIGTLAHLIVQCRLTHMQPDLTAFSAEEIEKAGNSVRSYEAWEAKHTLAPVACERQIVSEIHHFGGTLDLIAVVDGILTLVDFKTGKAIYDEHLHQLAAYLMLAEEAGFAVQEARILRIGRTEDEGFEEIVRPAKAFEPHREMFMHCLGIYRLKQALGGG